ncbi:MAG: EAL domain-containing protein [Nitrospinae bacterium]|nr:EAL domain-containing protein [Nitrospinota bacterium]
MNHSSSLDSKIKSFKSIEIFNLLPDEKLELLIRDSREIILNPGETLFREGDAGDAMYVILSGEIAIEKENTMIARKGRGNYFGEMTLIEDKPRSATIKAITKSRLLEIMKEQFLLHFASTPQALMSVLKTVSERARENLTALDQGMKILKAEKKLNANLQHLLDDTTNEIYIFDAESYHFISLNTSASKNLGYKKLEITELSLFDVIGNMTQENFEELVKPLQWDEVEEVVFNGHHRRKDGSSYPVEVRFKLQKTETPPVFVGIAQDISQLKELEEKNESLTFYDPLTGLPNKHLVLEKLNSELLKAKKANKSVAVLLMDLDNFKIINDSMGHDAGDTLLQAVAERLKDWSSPNWCVARFGGDEFIIILSDINNEVQAAETASSLLKLFKEPFIINGQKAYISLSIGISYYPLDGDDGRSLIKDADTAMYIAKDEGKNKYCHFSSDMETQAKNKLILESDLRKALEQNEFVLYYQPKLALDSETIIGFEALVRWNHPSRGLVPPLDFIPLAEKTKLIIPLGEWVLRTACKQMKIWLDMGLAIQNIAVNLSACQFSQPDLVSMIRNILEETGIHPENLDLEITESVLMDNAESAAIQLRQLSVIGIKLSIDDFGTGYSSLSYLNRFPLNNLKIDRTFVKDITCEEDAPLAKAIVNMAKALGLKTIAEGVETEVQKEVLRSIGCDFIQGYLLSKPVPAEEATKLLSSSK